MPLALLAAKGEARVADIDLEVLGRLVLVEDGADRDADPGLAMERRALALDRQRDAARVPLGLKLLERLAEAVPHAEGRVGGTPAQRRNVGASLSSLAILSRIWVRSIRPHPRPPLSGGRKTPDFGF